MNAEASASVGGLLRETRAQPDAALLLAHVLRSSRAWLLAHDDAPVPPAHELAWRELLRRRARGEPVAYLTGQREFWSLPLRITPAVLVPRPETELLVERALALLGDEPATVADLGTGSGAIALACARERPRWHIIATDASADALGVARANALALGLGNVEFLAGDWLAPLAGRRLRLLLSNPPYIATGDPAMADPALRHEPRSALVAGEDGFDALRAIVAAAPLHLLPGGALLLEHGATQAGQLAEMLVAKGFAHVRSHPDLAGHDRVTEAHWGTSR